MTMLALNFVKGDISGSRKIFLKPYQPSEQKTEENTRVSKVKDGNNYEISLSPLDDFVEFKFNLKDNLNLTKWIFFQDLSKALSKVFDQGEYSVGYKGKYKRVEVVVGRHDLGTRMITLTPYFIEKYRVVGFLVDYEFKPTNPEDRSKDVQILSLSLDKDGRENKNIYTDRYRIISWFLRKWVSQINENSNLQLESKLYEAPSSSLKKKVYSFAGNRTDSSQFMGVSKYGPLKEIDGGLTYVFLFEHKYRIFANDLYQALKGISFPGTFTGMDKMFGVPIDKGCVHHISLVDYTKKDLDDAISEIERLKEEKGNLIVIFIEPSRDTQYEPSPYYYSKLALTKRGIPLQVIDYKERSKRNALKWATSNIGLQIFAKSGGIPWLVQPSVSECLILGIGTAHKKDEDGRIKKYYSYSICMDSSGLFKKLVVLSNSTDREAFHNGLRRSIQEIFKDPEFSRYRRCALHIPSKINKYETQSLLAAIEEVTDIEFCVVKVNVNNPFNGFSEHNTKVPYESEYVRIGEHEYIVWFEGLQYGKEIVRGRIGGPIHIQIVSSNAKSGMTELDFVQDVLNLSGANWRGFNAKLNPISIYYSKLVSRYKAAFEDIEELEADEIEYNLPWFL